MDFTGEQLVLGQNTRWFWDGLASEHVARYLFAAGVIPPASVLDAACGTGYGSAILKRRAVRVVGVDRSAEVTEFARREWGNEGISFQTADVQSLPFPAEVFDAVVSFETIEHVPDTTNVIAEFARVLAPGGIAIVSTPNRDVYRWTDHRHDDGNPYHVHEMDAPEFLSLLGRHFEVRQVFGQLKVDDYLESESSTLKPTGGTSSMLKSFVRLTTGALLSRPSVAPIALPRLRRRFWPAPFDEGPWKYLIAVCVKPGAPTGLS